MKFEVYKQNLDALEYAIQHVILILNDLNPDHPEFGHKVALVEHHIEETRVNLEKNISQVKRLEEFKHEGRERLKNLMGLYSELLNKYERMRRFPHSDWQSLTLLPKTHHN